MSSSTLFWDENLLLFTFLTGKLRKSLFWANKKSVHLLSQQIFVPKYLPKISSRQHQKVLCWHDACLMAKCLGLSTFDFEMKKFWHHYAFLYLYVHIFWEGHKILQNLYLTFDWYYITVWPEPIWIKVKKFWLSLPQHQSTYPRGQESVSIEITPFRQHFIKFSKTVFY